MSEQKHKLKSKIISYMFVIVAVLVILIVFASAASRARERARRSNCMGNLKQIGLGLKCMLGIIKKFTLQVFGLFQDTGISSPGFLSVRQVDIILASSQMFMNGLIMFTLQI